MNYLEITSEHPTDRQGWDQPRPALGLRPWFALLRRARSLRRFALAIRAGRVTADCPKLPITVIVEVSGELRSPVNVGITFRQRLLGVRAVPAGTGVLLAASGVHGLRLTTPLTVLALDEGGQVLAIHQLNPGTIWHHRQAKWMLELPRIGAAPRPGSTVRLLGRRRAV